MPHAPFVHLRVHSAYSLLEGAIRIPELVKLCRDLGMPAVAIADTDNLFGALEFSDYAASAGVQPIVGCQLSLVRATGHGHRLSEKAMNGASLRATASDPIVLLAQSETGYRNLLKLLSFAYTAAEGTGEPRVTEMELAGHAGGLIALTGGPKGPVGRLLREGQKDAAKALLLDLKGMFPGRLYIELMRHGLPEEAATEPGFVALAFAHDVPLVATNEAFFSTAEMHEAHDALMCIRAGAHLAQADRPRLTREHRFKSADEMRALFQDIPEAIDNTLVIARRCAFMVESVQPILPPFRSESGLSEEEELRRQARAGLEERLQGFVFKAGMTASETDAAARPYRERLEYELNTILKMGYAGYFLIVADFIRWAKQHGIPVGPGRGSGAASVVAWGLSITDLDPLRFGLLFERFLNPERISMPDFDVDFCQERRDEVIRYVQEKYGAAQVAQIITFGKLQARAVLRDVGRVMGIPYGYVDKICKLVPNNPANPVTLDQAIEGEPQLQSMMEADPEIERLMGIARKLEGLYRHASTHAAGIVIGDRPLDELIPLYRDPRSNMLVTGFSMKYVELAGLVKFDFLGLKTLTVLAKAEALVRVRGTPLDIARLPLDDRPTFEMIGHGDTTGVFQLESSGMRDSLRSMKPDQFEDIIAMVALYRPGPMDNIPSYIRRKHGREKPDYLYPTLEGILKETFGIIIYQEQVMQIAQVLSGYSLGSADILRRAMGKKIKSEMAQQQETFVEGAKARGVPASKASDIFELVAKFAGYGFVKSHATGYALIAYQTAYMKANYPVEFFAASMTFDLGNTDKLNIFRQELGRLGIALKPPDINASGAEFTVERDPKAGKGAIRYALAAIRNVGKGAMEAIVAEREKNGPFKNLADFARRIDPHHVNKRQVENLVRAGAFDVLNPNRRQTFEGTESILRHASAETHDRASSQMGLFGGGGSAPDVRLNLPAVADWAPMDRLKEEFDAIGFYLSAHPLDAFAKALRRLKVKRIADVLAEGEGGAVKLAGTVIGKKERTSQKGSRYAFVQLSDTSGVFEVTVFAEQLAQAREYLEIGNSLLIRATAQFEGESVRFTTQGLEPLAAKAADAAPGLLVFVGSVDPLRPLREVLQQQGRGSGPVRIVSRLADQTEVEIGLPGGYAISPAVMKAVKGIPGILDVQEI
ncbi:MAG: DNA polymerase III subunit alpha [Rhodospirillales bacterium]|nr:DNA polymerase III subunit alpha [Rhodospirillales bacterium]